MKSGNIIGQVLKGQTVLLDGSVIDGSTLEDCILIFRGEDVFTLSNNVLIRCKLCFEGAAALTMKAVKGFTDSGYPTGVAFG